VSVALVIQNAMRVHHTVLYVVCPIRLYNIFPHYPTNGTIFGESGGGGITEPKLLVLIFYTTFA